MSLLLGFVCLVAGALGLHVATTEVVHIPGLGDVTGNSTDQARLFLGIPYAEPPVGTYRFQAARPKKPWKGNLDATQLKHACIQTKFNNSKSIGISEDCLTLNIYAPPNLQEKAPVFFWIHGGGYVHGTGADFDGSVYASMGTVVVTINYRLGALGFLSSPELAAENEGGLGGLNGVVDQLTALQWVVDNIAAFGGDPDDITIGGESAGSLSTCIITASHLSKGMFRNVILESGSCIGPWGPPASKYGLFFSSLFMKGMDVSDITELRSKSSEELIANAGFDTVTAAIDNFVLFDHLPPATLFASGNISAVPGKTRFLIGANTLDSLFAWPFFQPGAAQNVNEYKASLAEWLGNATVEPVTELYPAGSSDTDANIAWLSVNSDSCNVCPAREISDMLTATGFQVFSYQFAYNPGFPSAAYKGLAGHAMELTFVWHGTVPGPYEPSLAKAMQQYWSNFIQRAIPDKSWPIYESKEQKHMLLSLPHPTVVAGFNRKRCDFWHDYIQPATGDRSYEEFCLQIHFPKI